MRLVGEAALLRWIAQSQGNEHSADRVRSGGSGQEVRLPVPPKQVAAVVRRNSQEPSDVIGVVLSDGDYLADQVLAHGMRNGDNRCLHCWSLRRSGGSVF